MSLKRKPLVVVTRRLPDAVETRMRELFDVRLSSDDAPMVADTMAAALREADVLVPTVTDEIDAGLIAQAGPNLRLIANFGNGVDHIDVAAALERDITVTNTPGVLTEDTADMTMALILAVSRRVAEGARIIPDDEWTTGWSPTWMLGRRITGKRLGIVGESGSGKSVTALTLLGLTREPSASFGSSIRYRGKSLLDLSERDRIRGNRIATIFQDPMTSLNPVFRIGAQIAEAILVHEDVSRREARRRAVDLLGAVGIPQPERRVDDYPHEFSAACASGR